MWLEIGIFALLLISVGLLYLIGRQQPGTGLVGSLTSPAPYAFVLRHVIVIGLLLALFGAVRWYAESTAESKAEAWLNSYMGAETVAAVGSIDLSKPEPSPSQSPTPTATPSPTPTATPSPSPTTTATPVATPFPTPNAKEAARLDAQLREIRDRIRHHSIVMGYFYINYFVAIVMIMVSSLFVAATLFFIAQKGWTGASSYVEGVFIVAAMWAAFYGLFPPVFEQQKNITDNKELFLKYKVLESEIKSYSITHLRLKKDGETNVSPLVPAEFINYVDSEMAGLGNIAVGFDPTKISYSDAFSLAKPSPSPSPGESPSKTGAKPRRSR